jgi:HAD-hyrolase-like
VVGDTTDDAAAAQAAGIRCVLMEDGPHPREALTACNVSIASSLVYALGLGVGAHRRAVTSMIGESASNGSSR